MKTINKYSFLCGILLLVLGFTACSDSFLDEKPLDFFSPENILVDKPGFESALNALHSFSREEHALTVGLADEMTVGTDVATAGVSDTRFFNDYKTILPEFGTVVKYWEWSYTKMIKLSNLIISRAESADNKLTSQERDAIIAEAKFFRGWTYNLLVNLYGGVPIVDKEHTSPKYDFTRASRREVLEFVQNDLEDAVKYLPVVENVSNGRIYKAAAYHLLSEVYISLGRITGDQSFYDKSIAAATKVIGGECGNYQVMTSRFGDLSRPGDVFSDLFKTNHQNRASGNLEVIWAWQFENFTIGGGTGAASDGGNLTLRMWAPGYDNLQAPDAKRNIPTDSIGRGIGNNSPLNYVKYEIWNYDTNDMRNSKHNIRRDFYYNNIESQYFGQKILLGKDSRGRAVIARPDGSVTKIPVDTMRWYYPWFKKIDGKPWIDDVTTGRTYNEIIKMRLAETYLLRAEAHFLKGRLDLAANDINVIRSRANAKLINDNEVTIDFILDERARELIIEEPRRRTLVRMGLLYERATRYNQRAANTMQPYNELWPIPQKAIDANTGAKLTQNPGYPGAN